MTRLTHEQRKERAARDALEARIKPVILAELQRLLRSLRAKLRRLDRHRPKLSKASFYSQDMWAAFRDRLHARLLEELKSGALTLADLSSKKLSAIKDEPVILNTDDIAMNLEATLGDRITNIETGLRREVGKKVRQWYSTPGSTLQDIIDDLSGGEEGPFSDSRAETIARTEITRLNANVKQEEMNEMGATEWWWSTRNDATTCHKEKRWMKGPDGQMYTGCRELHGKRFSINDAMPPDASHPNCRCSPIIIIPGAPIAAKPFGSPIIDTGNVKGK